MPRRRGYRSDSRSSSREGSDDDDQPSRYNDTTPVGRLSHTRALPNPSSARPSQQRYFPSPKFVEAISNGAWGRSFARQAAENEDRRPLNQNNDRSLPPQGPWHRTEQGPEPSAPVGGIGTSRHPHQSHRVSGFDPRDYSARPLGLPSEPFSPAQLDRPWPKPPLTTGSNRTNVQDSRPAFRDFIAPIRHAPPDPLTSNEPREDYGRNTLSRQTRESALATVRYDPAYEHLDGRYDNPLEDLDEELRDSDYMEWKTQMTEKWRPQRQQVLQEGAAWGLSDTELMLLDGHLIIQEQRHLHQAYHGPSADADTPSLTRDLNTGPPQRRLSAPLGTGSASTASRNYDGYERRGAERFAPRLVDKRPSDAENASVRSLLADRQPTSQNGTHFDDRRRPSPMAENMQMIPSQSAAYHHYPTGGSRSMRSGHAPSVPSTRQSVNSADRPPGSRRKYHR